MQKLIEYFTKQPKTLLIIDSIGAFLTAFLLWVVVRPFNEFFGMPQNELTYLSIIAVLFSMYSAACFLFLKSAWTPFIRFIGMANLMYCTLTLGLLIQYRSLLSIIGIAYFLIEIIIICALSYVELHVATKLKAKSI